MYKRQIQISVNNYIHCGNYYLFLKRSETKKIDPGVLNAVGGKVESGEDFLTACIRETEEETGPAILASQIRLVGLVRLEEGYEDDWMMAWFKTKVSKMLPKSGTKTSDGELVWMHMDEIYKSKFVGFIDDMKYTFEEIDQGKRIFFMSAKIDPGLKVKNYSLTKLK